MDFFFTAVAAPVGATEAVASALGALPSEIWASLGFTCSSFLIWSLMASRVSSTFDSSLQRTREVCRRRLENEFPPHNESCGTLYNLPWLLKQNRTETLPVGELRPL